MKLRVAKKQLRSTEREILAPAVEAYVTSPDDADCIEISRSLLETAVVVVLLEDPARSRPPKTRFADLRLDVDAVDETSLVGSGQVTWESLLDAGAPLIVEPLRFAFDLRTLSRRRVRYELVIGDPDAA
jgi:hypothetical protein